MKKSFTFLVAVLLMSGVFLPRQASAQSPEKMSYQAVIRDANNALITTQEVGMQISILQGSVNGLVVYEEMQTPTTNTNGLVSIEIGGGAGFSSLDWSKGSYFIKTEIDPAGGTNYTITGISQLMSVPYALFSKTAESVIGGITETDPVYTSSEAANITLNDITNLGSLFGTNTGDQDLSSFAVKKALEDTASAIRSAIPNVNGFISIETDPVFGGSEAASITAGDITKLASLSGINTGDQNLNSYAVKSALKDTASAIRSAIPDVSGFISIETDPVFGESEAASITAGDITKLASLSGTNTGDQNISGLAAKTALEDTASAIRSAIPNVSGFISIETDPVFGLSVAAGITGADTTKWNNDLVDDADADITNEIQNFNQVLLTGNDANGNSLVNTGKIGVGTASPNAESSMEIATALPVIFPSMTQSEVNAIATPVEGMVQFNTDAHKLQVYAMLTNNASILNEIFTNNTSGHNNFHLDQSFTSPIDGQIVAIEIMYKDYDFGFPDIDIFVAGVYQGIQQMPSFTQFTWHTFTLETPAPVTAGMQFGFSLIGPGVDFHEFATNSNYPNGSACCFMDSGDDDLLFRIHIQPTPGSYGWQNMH